MWALSGRRIANAEARACLAAYRAKRDLQSDVWLLDTHLRYLRVRRATAMTAATTTAARSDDGTDGARDDAHVCADASICVLPLRLLLPPPPPPSAASHADACTAAAAAGVVDDCRYTLLACPLAAVDNALRKAMVHACATTSHHVDGAARHAAAAAAATAAGAAVVGATPPWQQQLLPSILHRTDDGQYAWRTATLEEVLDASFYGAAASMCSHTDTNTTHTAAAPTTTASMSGLPLRRYGAALLCARSCFDAGQPMPCVGDAEAPVQLLNAQDTSNPFALDATLRHIDALDGTPLPESVGSGLTTVHSQFAYTSLRWLDAACYATRVRHGTACGDTPAATPHAVPSVEVMRLVHVTQLPMVRQARLLSRTPDYILQKCTRQAYVMCERRWHTAQSIGLLEPLHSQHVPCGNDDDDNVNRRHTDGGATTTPHSNKQQQQQALLWVDAQNESYTGAVVLRSRYVTRYYYHASQLPSLRGDATAM